MKPLRSVPTVSVALAAVLWVVPCAKAEIPNKSKEQLVAAASNAFEGTVRRASERKEKRGNFEYAHGVVEVMVERVDKGTDVAVNDRVSVRYWRKKWTNEGNPPPDHYGHRNLPAKGDLVEIYAKGDRTTGFDVLSPNGFFAVTKGPRPHDR